MNKKSVLFIKDGLKIAVFIIVFGSFAGMVAHAAGTSSQTSTTATTTSTTQPTSTFSPPPPGIVIYKAAGSGLSIEPPPSTVVKRAPSYGTASSSITTTVGSSGFTNLPGCVPVAQQNCRDINNKLANPSLPENCPDLCRATRQINGNPDSPSSVIEAICPSGYASVASYDAQKEYVLDTSSYDRPYPIPDMATYQSYVAAGDTCRPSDNIFGEVRILCVDQNGQWMQSSQCRTWGSSGCSEYYREFKPSNVFNQYLNNNQGTRYWTGVTRDSGGRSFYGIGQIDTQFSCLIPKNQGANNTFPDNRFRDYNLCRFGKDSYVYINPEQVNLPSMNGWQPVLYDGHYLYGGGCSTGTSVIGDNSYAVGLVYTICHKNPGTTLTWSGRYVDGTVVCARIKPSWK